MTPLSTWLAALGAVATVLTPLASNLHRYKLWLAKRLKMASRSGHVRSAHFLLAITVRLLPLSERDRYFDEFRAELLDVPRDTRLRYALSLLRGVFVLRLRRELKDKAADAAVRRAKG